LSTPSFCLRHLAITALVLAGLLIGNSSTVSATPIQFGASGLSNPDHFEDFNIAFGLPGFAKDFFDNEFVAYGDQVFVGGTFSPSDGHVFSQPLISSDPILEIDFLKGASAATFDLTAFNGGQSSTVTVTSFLAGSVVENIAVPADTLLQASVFGFSDSLFDRITIDMTDIVGSSFWQIDNLAFNDAPVSTVPVPAPFALLIASLAGLVFAGRRRAKVVPV